MLIVSLNDALSKNIVSACDVDNIYEAIVEYLSIQSASEPYIPNLNVEPCIKPYWDDELRDLPKAMHLKRLFRTKANRPRDK